MRHATVADAAGTQLWTVGERLQALDDARDAARDARASSAVAFSGRGARRRANVGAQSNGWSEDVGRHQRRTGVARGREPECGDASNEDAWIDGKQFDESTPDGAPLETLSRAAGGSSMVLINSRR